ncbi:hypothetical protein BaRGS_00000552, partial [Batillaria attramentaria]
QCSPFDSNGTSSGFICIIAIIIIRCSAELFQIDCNLDGGAIRLVKLATRQNVFASCFSST